VDDERSGQGGRRPVRAQGKAGRLCGESGGDSLSLSWGLPPGVSSETIEDVLGPDGLITVDGFDELVVQVKGKATEVFNNLDTNMYDRQIAAFAEAIRQDKPVASGGEDGMLALEISLAALRSIETGQAIAL